jgi:hypothetical protein
MIYSSLRSYPVPTLYPLSRIDPCPSVNREHVTALHVSSSYMTHGLSFVAPPDWVFLVLLSYQDNGQRWHGIIILFVLPPS